MLPKRYSVIFKSSNADDFAFLGESFVELKKGAGGTVPYSLLSLNMDASLLARVEAIQPSSTTVTELTGFPLNVTDWLTKAEEAGFVLVPPESPNEGSP